MNKLIFCLPSLLPLCAVRTGRAAKPRCPGAAGGVKASCCDCGFHGEKCGSSRDLREAEKDFCFLEERPLRRCAPAPPKGEPRSCLPLWGRCPEEAERVLLSLNFREDPSCLLRLQLSRQKILPSLVLSTAPKRERPGRPLPLHEKNPDASAPGFF